MAPLNVSATYSPPLTDVLETLFFRDDRKMYYEYWTTQRFFTCTSHAVTCGAMDTLKNVANSVVPPLKKLTKLDVTHMYAFKKHIPGRNKQWEIMTS